MVIVSVLRRLVVSGVVPQVKHTRGRSIFILVLSVDLEPEWLLVFSYSPRTQSVF